MKDFGLSLEEWRGLTRLEKRILHYSRIMEACYLGRMNDAAGRKQDEYNKTIRAMDKMPELRRGR